MDMGGITVRYAPGEAAVRAILAGVDALLMPPVPDAAFEALQAAVRSGRISPNVSTLRSAAFCWRKPSSA